MREIKFRAWDEESKRYIHSFNYEGYTINDEDGDIYVSKQLEESGTTPVLRLEQFTGIYDSTTWDQLTESERQSWIRSCRRPGEWKGRKIYEGDRVVISEDGETSTHEIVWCGESGYPAFDLKPSLDTDSNGLSHILATGEIEIIGNIHENELNNHGKNHE
jgi:hypothetical protein